MRVSTKGVYALEVIVYMASTAAPNRPVALKEIAQKRGLSEKYLERIIKLLREAGFVRSIRGVFGGYCLVRKPEKITVQEVLNVAEGELAPVKCLIGDADCGMDCKTCPTQGVWEEIWECILDITHDVTIGQIVAEVKEIQKNIDRNNNE